MNIHSLMRHTSKALSVVLLVGCSSASDTSPSDSGVGTQTDALTCDLLLGDNCWAQALDAARACLPDPNARGTLSDDDTRCTYPDHEVTFHNGSEAAWFDRWDFSVTHHETACLDLLLESERWELTTASGTVAYDASADVTLTCADGAHYRATALEVLGCGNLSRLPGHHGAMGMSNVDLRLTGAAEPVPTFACER